jgi:hypothetical protein
MAAAPDINTMAVNPARANQRHNFVITDFFLGYDEAGEVPGKKADIMGKVDESYVVAKDGEKKTKGGKIILSVTDKTTQGLNRIFQDWFGIVNPHHYFFLALLGIFTACVTFFTDLISVYIIQWKLYIVRETELDYLVRYAIYIAFTLVFMLISAAMSPLVSKEVEGSGIPEIKAIIAGVTIHKYLAIKTGIAKQIGLIAALIAGMPIGREGPFIHLSACIA